MSGYLWKYYLQDDVDSFRQLLENSSYSVRQGAQKSHGGGQSNTVGFGVGSPGSYGTSPTLTAKGLKPSDIGPSGLSLTRADVNRKDTNGMTILHHAASSTSETAYDFATALLDHPLTDLYAQDLENGWTALHRAFYFGNIAIARAILERDMQDALGHGSGGMVQQAGGLVKIKDKEGNGPFDLFATTVTDRTLRPEDYGLRTADIGDENDDDVAQGDSGDRDDGSPRVKIIPPSTDVQGDEVFTFGSNRNHTLGFGDGDDRQYPERITLKRPDHLLQRFYREYLKARPQHGSPSESTSGDTLHSGSFPPKPVSALPTLIRSRPLIIQDVQMSKLHTAVLTTDPESNLYMCGHGPGGRLGTGDEATRFQFVCVEGGALAHKKVASVALGQDHTLALSDEGEIFSWGNNAFGQLGYALPKTNLRDEDPIQTLPRQIFGLLKREVILGIAASRIHSVAHTSTSLYTFGKNEGQLGIVDSDARSLEYQIIPRTVAASKFSAPIKSVSAIDRATVCLLENHEVWVFANYGYRKMSFPLDGFTNYFLKNSFLTTNYDKTPNRICKITSGGNTICAMSTSGEVYTVAVSQRTEPGPSTTTSTTNPTKIRDAVSVPHRLWSLKKGHMAARDVSVDHDGSIILTTEAGSVWRRIKRAKIKDATAAGTGEYKPKDYKFSRVPNLTRVVAVRASAYGAYAAVRKDCDVTRTQIVVDEKGLWKSLFPLLSFRELATYEENSDDEDPSARFWRRPSELETLKKRVMASKDLERDIADILERAAGEPTSSYNMDVRTTVSDVRIPINSFILAGRSRIWRQGLEELRLSGIFEIADLLTVESDQSGRLSLLFQGLDFLTILNFVLYLYTDTLVDFWHYTRQHPKLAYRYRQIRTELMRLASKLELARLETAARQMVEPIPSLDQDMEIAIRDPVFFADGDVLIQLADSEVRVHSALICRRSPFFEGLFQGRAGGMWLSDRRDLLEEPSDAITIDLKHVESNIFEMVLRHIYADTGEELSDDVVTNDLDEFLDLVIDVMGVANELMIDRLSQVCQKVVGRFVNVRNACQLLNAIAPSSVTEFKNAGLKYLCLSLEAILQNGLLNELDENLLFELDKVVRDNQAAGSEFVRSGRMEALLHEKYPDLAEKIDRARQAKIDSITLQSKYAEAEARLASSLRTHSVDESASSTTQQKMRRTSSKVGGPTAESPVPSPVLKAKVSAADTIFGMDDEDEDDQESLQDPSAPEAVREGDHTHGPMKTLSSPLVGSPTSPWLDSKGKLLPSAYGAEPASSAAHSPSTPKAAATENIPATKSPIAPWGAAPLQTNKLDLKDIMTQASSSRTSNIALSLSSQPKKEDRPIGPSVTKMSQKERKKLQQTQQLAPPNTPPAVTRSASGPKPSSPWQTVSSGCKVALNDVLNAEKPSAPPTPSVNRTVTAPQLTMRQTIANNGSVTKQKATTGPSATPTPPQQRSVSDPQPPMTKPTTPMRGDTTKPSPSPQQPPTPITRPSANPTPIQSIRHIPQPRPAEPTLQLSMADILSQQQAEKEVIKEAVAKRSLQDIQQEQEFQQWWDQESRRVMEAEAALARRAERSGGGGKGRGKGGRGRGGGGGKGRGRGQGGGAAPAAPPASGGVEERGGRSGRGVRGGRSGDGS